MKCQYRNAGNKIVFVKPFLGFFKNSMLSDSHKYYIYPTCFPRILVSQATFRCQTDSLMRRARTTSIICEHCFVSHKLCVLSVCFIRAILELYLSIYGMGLNHVSSTHVASSWRWRCLITWSVSWIFSSAVSLRWSAGVILTAAIFWVGCRQANTASIYLNRETEISVKIMFE